MELGLPCSPTLATPPNSAVPSPLPALFFQPRQAVTVARPKPKALWIGCRLDTSPPAVIQPGLELSRRRDGERKPRLRAVRHAQIPSHLHPLRLGQSASAQGRYLAGHGIWHLRHAQPIHLQRLKPGHHAKLPAVRHQRAQRNADGRHRHVRPVWRRTHLQLRPDRPLGRVQRGPQLGGVQPAPRSTLPRW